MVYSSNSGDQGKQPASRWRSGERGSNGYKNWRGGRNNYGRGRGWNNWKKKESNEADVDTNMMENEQLSDYEDDSTNKLIFDATGFYNIYVIKFLIEITLF